MTVFTGTRIKNRSCRHEGISLRGNRGVPNVTGANLLRCPVPDKITPIARGGQAEHRESYYDLVVIGAGIAGLNALYAAAQYMPSPSRVLLIDAKDRPGGMWTFAYDYVRLHQPHPLFTVANEKWKWRKPRHYLATRDEVQQHLAGCLESLLDRFDVETRFGHYASCVREVNRSGTWIAEIDSHRIDDPDRSTRITAGRVIHAAGFDHEAPQPLALSAKSVLSIPPADLTETLAKTPDKPVYVIGGGKTGMDTILAVLTENPARAVTLINGNGTSFLNRTRCFPTGLGRWFGGAVAADVFRDGAVFFDGHNEKETRAHFIANYASNDDPRNLNYVYGVLSEAEDRRIETGLHDTIWDYLEDVVQTRSGPVMQMKGGAKLPIAAGSIIVNCTGSLFRGETAEDAPPCLSPNDVILSINMHDAMHILTTYASFVLSHLFLSGKLRKSGLYFLDLKALLKKDRQVFSAATTAQSYHNLLMGLKGLSPATRKKFGMDFNLWYPLPRRLLAFLRIRKTARDDIRHCRKSLDIVVKRFDIRGGQI
jgi:hypothetical protein